MSKNKDAFERIAQMQRAKEEAAAQGGTIEDSTLVDQLAHEDAGEPNFAAIAEKLKERQDAEKEPTFLEGTTKFTIYVDNDVADAFKALCVKRGDQRRYATQAFADFISKKIQELGL